MLFLVIDTSLQGLTLGLAKLDGQTYEILEVYGSNHPQEAAARLPELCQNLLTPHSLSLKEVDGMLVSHGPGSFTGIKIGLSFASGWKRAETPIKIWGVSSFKGLLSQLPQTSVLLLPATQTAGYFAMKDATGKAPRVGVVDKGLATVFSLADEKHQHLSPLPLDRLNQVAILGPWPRLEEYLTSLNLSWKTIDTTQLYRSVVAGMVEEFIAKSRELSEGDLMPIYLRKSAPEEKLDASQAKS